MRTFGWMIVAITCAIVTGCGEKHRANDEVPADASAKADGKKGGDAKESDKKKADGAEAKEGASGPVELSPAAQRRIGLVVTEAKVAPMPEVLTLSGTVQPIESRLTRVRPLARGRIVEVLAKLGDQVRQGQLLARFDNIEAADLAAQYNTARAEMARLRIQQAVMVRQAERSRKLVAIGAVPQKELEALEAERQGHQEAILAQESTLAGLDARLKRFGVAGDNPGAASTASITSPFAGVVTAVQAASGEVVDTSSELFTVTDLSSVYIAGQIYEKDLARVHIGEPATVLIAAYSNTRFSGRVASISSQLDPQTRTATVRVEVVNSNQRLRVEMFATLELATADRRQVLTVPVDAIQRIEGKPVVFVRQDDRHFEVRPVQLGRLVGGLVEVTGGLKAEELIVAKGSFHLKSTLLGKELVEE